jgi:hypothetical protein
MFSVYIKEYKRSKRLLCHAYDREDANFIKSMIETADYDYATSHDKLVEIIIEEEKDNC